MKKRKHYIKNLNFKRLSRELGFEAKTNHERINSHIRGKYLGGKELEFRVRPLSSINASERGIQTSNITYFSY